MRSAFVATVSHEHVRHVRRKLEPDREHPVHIISVPGYGYVLEC